MNENQTVWTVLVEVYRFDTNQTNVLGVFTSELRAEEECERFGRANPRASVYVVETTLNTEN